MKYEEIIKLLEPHAKEEVFFNGYEDRQDTAVHFYADGVLLFCLSRKYGQDEVNFE